MRKSLFYQIRICLFGNSFFVFKIIKSFLEGRLSPMLVDCTPVKSSFALIRIFPPRCSSKTSSYGSIEVLLGRKNHFLCTKKVDKNVNKIFYQDSSLQLRAANTPDKCIRALLSDFRNWLPNLDAALLQLAIFF